MNKHFFPFPSSIWDVSPSLQICYGLFWEDFLILSKLAFFHFSWGLSRCAICSKWFTILQFDSLLKVWRLDNNGKRFFYIKILFYKMSRFSNYNGIFTFLEKSTHFARDYFSYLNYDRQKEYQSHILQLSGCRKMSSDFLYIFFDLIMSNMQEWRSM